MAEDNRRYPANLQGILRFCTEHTQGEDTTGPSQFASMTDEMKQWLSEALNSMCGNSPVKVMVEDLDTLMQLSQDDSDDAVERKQDALSELQSYVEDIDLAVDFCKIGGVHLLPTLLASRHGGIRWRAADLVATATQNNPFCQTAVLEANLLEHLLRCLDDSAEVELVRVKALYAVSCLTRHCSPAQDDFVARDGFSVLLRAMQTDVEKLQTKASFLLSSLCTEQPKFKDVLCDMGMVEQLVGLLLSEHRTFHEHLCSALVALVEDHPRAISECGRTEFNLRLALEQRREQLAGRDECTEEVDHITQLLDIVFASDEGNATDR